MKTFERTSEYEQKLFLEALCDDKNVIKDATIVIKYDYDKRKYRAWCEQSKCYLQFPNALRIDNVRYTADVVQVKETPQRSGFYRTMKESIRKYNTNILAI